MSTRPIAQIISNFTLRNEMSEANLLDEIKKFLEAEYAMPQADNLDLWLVKNGIMR